MQKYVNHEPCDFLVTRTTKKSHTIIKEVAQNGGSRAIKNGLSQVEELRTTCSHVCDWCSPLYFYDLLKMGLEVPLPHRHNNSNHKFKPTFCYAYLRTSSLFTSPRRKIVHLVKHLPRKKINGVNACADQWLNNVYYLSFFRQCQPFT